MEGMSQAETQYMYKWKYRKPHITINIIKHFSKITEVFHIYIQYMPLFTNIGGHNWVESKVS
jgi:hypothetical protein